MNDSGSSKPWLGVHIPEGCSLQISAIKITIDSEGHASSLSGGEPRTLPAMWFYWLEIAMSHLDDADCAHKEALKAYGEDNTEEGAKWLIKEFAAAMQCITASAIAVDALDKLVRDHVDISSKTLEAWRKNETSQPAQILEILRSAFDIPEKKTKELKQYLIKLFKWRKWSVHPDGGFEAPVLYAEYRVSTDWRFIAFRRHNAMQLLRFSLVLIAYTLQNPRRKHKSLSKYCEGAYPLLEKLVKRWESLYGELGIPKSAAVGADNSAEQIDSSE